MKTTPSALERFYVQWEFSVGTNISASCGAETTTADLLAMAGEERRNEYLSLGLGYRENKGDERLRELIAEEYENLAAADIQLCCGGSEAIFLLMHTEISPGDRIIAEKPLYQTLFQVAEDLGVEVDWLDLMESEDYVPDPERLAGLLAKRPAKMVVINHPHSPTGSILSAALLTEIVDICGRYGALLVSDEVYWGAFYDKADVVAHAADLAENVVTIGDMTKPYGLGGLRIGWLACRRRDILQEASALKDYTTMCAAGPSEYLSVIALEHKEKILARNMGIAAENITLFDRVVKDSGGKLSWVRPRGGYTGFVTLSVPGMTGRDLALGLIKQRDVLILPGDVFGDEGKFRIGVGTRRDEFVRGVEALANFVSRL
ncbi:MAG: aminotransferase class I/II-fold pyridoxal phosphate-dependent enzyme [Deltaproteobacteria bacterium]|nr:aminotransferase class I/II-fold pyridoxal phosphate-dependent enzyme [Candidatus Zymogenaceae bacterium]